MIEWPTETLAEKIRELDHKRVHINIELQDAEDITTDPKVGEQIVRFAPDVKTIGVGLRNERYGWIRNPIWGGVLVRALEGEERGVKKRCLQYVYTWTKQLSVVSFFWMVSAPFLMGLWGLIVRWVLDEQVVQFLGYLSAEQWDVLFSPGEWWLPVLATGLICFPLLVSGIWPHLRDRHNGDKFCVRSTTLLFFQGLMMWAVVFSWIVPVSIWFIAVVCLFYWIADIFGRTESSHEMDYLPVLVWLKPGDGEGEWVFEKACWDHYHYETACMEKDEMKHTYLRVYNVDYLREEEHVRLLIPNPWHSAVLGRHYGLGVLSVSAVICVATMIGMLYIVASGSFSGFPFHGVSFSLLGVLFVLAGRTLVRFSSDLLTEQDLEDMKTSKCHLSPKKIEILWNLERKATRTKKTDKRPRLVVITKLQDPFNSTNQTDFCESFRDDPEYLYGLITRLQSESDE